MRRTMILMALESLSDFGFTEVDDQETVDPTDGDVCNTFSIVS